MGDFWTAISRPGGLAAFGPAAPIAPRRPAPPVGRPTGSWLDRYHPGVHQAVPASAVQVSSASAESPMAQLERLGARHGIPRTANLKTWQRAIVRAVVIETARQQGVPVRLALALAIHESNLTMWKDPLTGAQTRCFNRRKGQLHSIDYGVMQINDKSHPAGFPAVAQDLEANVRFGLAKVARILKSKRAVDLGLGLGTWDGVLSVYGIGHLPKTDADWAIRRRRTPGYLTILAKLEAEGAPT